MTDWTSRLAAASLPTLVADRAAAEVQRLVAGGPDSGAIERYLETIVSLPWTMPYNLPAIDVAGARDLLNARHVGLERAKERILEEVAVRELAPDAPQPTFAFMGAPYTGKSHFAQTIAEILGRPLVRLSLAGVSRESDLRGRDRGAAHPHPGLFVDALIQAGTPDPVVYLSEASKIATEEGDPIDALVAAIDASRNGAFLDRYVGLPVDLSHVLFILSSQSDDLPGAVSSRVTYVDFAGYTVREKQEIARRFLLPTLLAAHELENRFTVSDTALRDVIEGWTFEPGIGRLETRLKVLTRAAALRVVDEHREAIAIDSADLEAILGPRPLDVVVVNDTDTVGVANGLVTNSAEGAITLVEAFTYPGREDFFITGTVGDVMRESCRVAWTVVRHNQDPRWSLPREAFEGRALHLHFPKGAVDKNGPSGGAAVAVAIASRFSGVAVRHEVAMTGELDLQGQVLRIGGLKKKILGAHRAGARVVLIPRENEPELSDVPAEVREDMQIVPVSNIAEVFERALVSSPLSAGLSPAAAPAVAASTLEPHEPREPQAGAVTPNADVEGGS